MDNKKRGFGQAVEAFFAGKGFYIVLFLCVAVIGVSAWSLMSGAGTDVEKTDLEEAANVPEDSYFTAAENEAKDSMIAEAPEVSDDTMAYEEQIEETVSEDSGEVAVWNETEPVQETAADALFVWPVNGEIDVPYSVTALLYDQTMADWRTHSGVDIETDIGTQVMAVSSGTVESIYTDDLYGVTVVIDHGAGVRSIYSNLAEVPTVYAGDGVTAGEVIGAVGDTAICETGQVTHLHFAMTEDGKSIDPAEYLP